MHAKCRGFEFLSWRIPTLCSFLPNATKETFSVWTVFLHFSYAFPFVPNGSECYLLTVEGLWWQFGSAVHQSGASTRQSKQAPGCGGVHVSARALRWRPRGGAWEARGDRGQLPPLIVASRQAQLQPRKLISRGRKINQSTLASDRKFPPFSRCSIAAADSGRRRSDPAPWTQWLRCPWCRACSSSPPSAAYPERWEHILCFNFTWIYLYAFFACAWTKPQFCFVLVGFFCCQWSVLDEQCDFCKPSVDGGRVLQLLPEPNRFCLQSSRQMFFELGYLDVTCWIVIFRPSITPNH